jgi:hypothetical protein
MWWLRCWRRVALRAPLGLPPVSIGERMPIAGSGVLEPELRELTRLVRCSQIILHHPPPSSTILLPSLVQAWG